MDPNTQAPDLQAATGQTPQVPMTGPSVLAALGSLQGPAPGLAAGSGMLSALAGRPGANPYLQQHAVNQQGSLDQINSLRVAQQHDVSAMVQQQQLQLQQAQMRERMLDRQLHRDNSLLTLTNDMLFGPHAIEQEDIRGNIAQQRADLFKKIGLTIPASQVAAWAKGGPSQQSSKDIAQYLAAADATDDPGTKNSLTAKAVDLYSIHGGKPEDWPAVSANLRSPATLKLMGMPSKEDLFKVHLDTEKGKIDLWIKQNPDFADTKGREGTAAWANEFTQKFAGKSIYQMDRNNPTDAATLDAARAYGELRARTKQKTDMELKLDDFKKREDIRQENAMARLQFTQDGKLAQPPKWSEATVQTALKPFNTAETAATELSAMNVSLNNLVKSGQVATQKGLLPWGQAFAQRMNPMNWKDPNWDVLNNLTGPVYVGLVDRGLNDEKGSRAMQMFGAQLELVKRNPSLESYQRLHSLYGYLFGRIAQRQLASLERRAEANQVPKEVALEARERFQQLYPQGPPSDPTAPRVVRAVDQAGRKATITLQPFEQLPPGFTETRE